MRKALCCHDAMMSFSSRCDAAVPPYLEDADIMASRNRNFSVLLAFVRGIHHSPLDSPHIGQWRGALMFSLICAWTNGWANNRDDGDLRHHRNHYDVTVIGRCWYYFEVLTQMSISFLAISLTGYSFYRRMAYVKLVDILMNLSSLCYLLRKLSTFGSAYDTHFVDMVAFSFQSTVIMHFYTSRNELNQAKQKHVWIEIGKRFCIRTNLDLPR